MGIQTTMHKATRSLVEARRKFAELDLSVVKVRRLGGAPARLCFENAVANEHRDILGTGCTRAEIVSGWIVYPFDRTQEQTEVVQHWWNYDSVSHVHFDTTSFDPLIINVPVDYVTDFDLKNLGMRWLDRLASNVGRDLVLRTNGQWGYTEFSETGEAKFMPLPDLRTENILIFR